MSTPRRVFIVGCPRSGTTLLWALLSAHPQVLGLLETQYFAYLVGQRRERLRRKSKRNISRSIRSIFSPLRIAMGIAYRQAKGPQELLRQIAEDADRADLAENLHPRFFWMRDSIDQFLRTVDTIAQDAGKTVWLEKSPAHLFYVDEIERYVEDTLFIHLVREGQHTVASLYDAGQKFEAPGWHKFTDIDCAIDEWNASVRMSRTLLSRPNHMLVRYEDMVSQPEVALTRLCDAMGVEFEPGMIDQRQQRLSGVSSDHQAAQPINVRNKFDSLFTPEQQAHIKQRVTPLEPEIFGAMVEHA
ncbi:sulfotransferase [Planctomycetales bacterium ZRK34]|nr:sulfotransferase [Planctomycetales bacterium ZRK34]